jgi:hypothetical protein
VSAFDPTGPNRPRTICAGTPTRETRRPGRIPPTPSATARPRHIQIRRSAPAKLCAVELDRAQAIYDVALRRVMTDLTGTTELRPDVVVDFTDPTELPYSYKSEGGGSHWRIPGWGRG